MAHEHSHGSATHSHSHSGAADHAPHDLQVPDSESHHQATVVATFDSYLRQALSANQRRRGDFFSLPVAQQALLPDYADLLSEVDTRLIVTNQFVGQMVEQNPFAPSEDAALSAPAPTEGDHERLRSTLRQFARDWSEAGKKERDATYGPMISSLQSHFEDLCPDENSDVRVLVPGAGLGRLAWEIIQSGFSCQANEFSLFMLIASSFILNHTTRKNEFAIHPYLHSFSNVRSKADLLSPIFVPDVLPSAISTSPGDFSFAAGDFLEVYGSDEDSWDAVCSCFFIDTARNIVEYLEAIYRILKVGGVWINCGPTLWHFENSADGSSSIELTLEDVKALARRIGFIIHDEREILTSYTSNSASLLRHEYTAAFWTATKA